MAEKKDKETETEAETEVTTELKPLSIRTTGAAQFCRAGVRFGRNAQTITDYTAEQLAAWEDEDNLIVDVG